MPFADRPLNSEPMLWEKLSKWMTKSRSQWSKLSRVSSEQGSFRRAERVANVALDHAAAKLGLSRHQAGTVTHLHGLYNNINVDIRVYQLPWKVGPPRHKQHIILTSDIPFLSENIRVEPKTPSSVLGSFKTGDTQFDQELTVIAPETVGLGVLSAEARFLLLQLRGHLAVEQYRLEWSSPRAPVFLLRIVQTLLEIVQHIRSLDDKWAVALNHRVQTDPIARVRRKAFSVMCRFYGDHPLTREAALTALDDRFPELRFAAAAIIGLPTARPTFIDLLKTPSLPHLYRLAIIKLVEPETELIDDALIILLQESAAGDRTSIIDSLSQLGAIKFLAEKGSIRSLNVLDTQSQLAKHASVREAAKRAHEILLKRHKHLEAGQLSIIESDFGKISLTSEENLFGKDFILEEISDSENE